MSGLPAQRGTGFTWVGLSIVSMPCLAGTARLAEASAGMKTRLRAWAWLLPVLALLASCARESAEGKARVTATSTTRSAHTRSPSQGARPDHVVLTWSGDPRTTQTIQWRTGPIQSGGAVQYAIKSQTNGLAPSDWQFVAATSQRLEDRRLADEPVVQWHRWTLRGLRPGTTYAYRVGSDANWSEPTQFTTAPAGKTGFKFIYLGDAQKGFPQWGELLHAALEREPDTAFVLMAGDLVNKGNQREEWDALFHAAAGVFDRSPLVPAVGNHECQGGRPRLFCDLFALPDNGPAGLPPGRVYAFEYGAALVVVLDSNLDPARQARWLEGQLRRTQATWKFVAFHHPLYSSAPRRDNARLRRFWAPIFDRYHVDLVLQGHDHAYLRTVPLRAGRHVASAAEGTTYVVSTSGSKMYAQARSDYVAVGFTNVPAYQVIETQASPARLLYSAYDREGRERDRLVIEKRVDEPGKNRGW